MRSTDDDTRGVVNPTEAFRHFALERVEPRPSLRWAVEHFWSVAWDLDEPFEQRIVPHPSVHLTFEPDGSFVTGVATGVWLRRLVGRGATLGVKFRAGGFRPFLGRSVRTITDHVLTVDEVFGRSGTALAAHAAPFIVGGRCAELVPVVEDWLVGLDLDRTDDQRRDAELVSSVVEEIGLDPGVVRVGAVADHLGVTTRQLQRIFADHVGVNPKWVIDRARVHEVGERVRRGGELRWADLAVELGYADQAHLIRRFTEAVGESPARYAAKVARPLPGSLDPQG